MARNWCFCSCGGWRACGSRESTTARATAEAQHGRRGLGPNAGRGGQAGEGQKRGWQQLHERAQWQLLTKAPEAFGRMADRPPQRSVLLLNHKNEATRKFPWTTRLAWKPAGIYSAVKQVAAPASLLHGCIRMATVQQLTNLLVNTPLHVVSEEDDRMLIEFRNARFFLTNSEIDAFLDLQPQITLPSETEIQFPGHFEHLIEIQTPFIGLSRFTGGDDPIQLDSPDGKIRIEVFSPSVEFLLSVFSQVDPRLFRRRIFMTPMMLFERFRSAPHPIHLLQIFRRLRTIRVIAQGDAPLSRQPRMLRSVAESSLFHFSYGTGVSLNLARSWERTSHRLKERREEDVQFPRRMYNSELLSYYHLALSSDSPILAYLALYNILEYFFVSASESALHKLLVDRIVTPEFSHTKPEQLRQLVVTVRRHDQRMDERKMLSTVLGMYFTVDEVTSWISEYEREYGNHYTEPKEIFGQIHTVDLNPSQYAASIGLRVYHIRNTLVHNKENDLVRFVPYSGQERVISSELPLVLFLAEQLILKTGKDIL
jgi:hypothetical protein